MKQTTYLKYHETPYVGKHEKRHYHVWRVLGPTGPQEQLTAYGKDEVREMIKGCWDYEVTTESGEVVNI